MTNSMQLERATVRVIAALASPGRQPRKRSVHLVVARPELVRSAERLAGAWNASIKVTSPDEFRTQITSALALPGASVVAVGLRDDLTDDLLLDMLACTQDFVLGEAAWESAPQCTLVTGRDLEQVARFIERLVTSPQSVATERFVQVRPGANFSEIVEIERESRGALRVRRVEEGAERLADFLRRPAAGIACQTHGTESCARGGGGVVLCGRAEYQEAAPAGTVGVLACGRELSCPRGPLPLPLRTLRAQVLLLASCSGLRLADGALTQDFSLGLSFLDGVGQAYVSTVSGTRGNELASTMFLAALASGTSLGEATALINAALTRTGIDAPRFMAVGSPSFVASPGRTRPAVLQATVDSDVLEINAGDQHFVEVLIDDERILTLVQQNALLLAALDPGPEVLWFSRFEVVPATANSLPRKQLRLFLFRFPEPIGRLCLRVDDRSRASSEALRLLAAIARWLALWRTFGLATREPEVYAELRAAYDDVAPIWSWLLSQLAWSTNARAALDAQYDAIRSLARTLTAELLPELVGRLRGTFWLPNETGASYQIEETRPYACSACGRPGAERRVRNPVTGDARCVRSCHRCGIMFDGQAEGDLHEIKLRAPDLVRRGERFALELEVNVGSGARAHTLSVYPRLSTHVVDQVIPEPDHADVILASAGRHLLTFVFQVPASLVPHQHFIKVIAATEQELIFASRLLFVE
jgi:hypothetical protein